MLLIQQMDFDCFLVDNILPTGVSSLSPRFRHGIAGPFVLMTSAGTEELVVQAYRNKVVLSHERRRVLAGPSVVLNR